MHSRKHIDKRKLVEHLIERKAEGQDLEYKKKLTLTTRLQQESFAKTLASFANTTGGYILIGIDEKTNEILGVEQETLDTQKIQEIATTLLSPSVLVEVDFIQYSSKTVALITIPKTGNIHLFENHVLVRKDSLTTSLLKEEIGLQLNFSREGRMGKQCYEKMWLIDRLTGKKSKIAYLRVQVLNPTSIAAKGCIAKCEVWASQEEKDLIITDRLAWQPRTVKDAIKPMDILPYDHEFLIVALAQEEWKGNFTFATRKFYEGIAIQLPPGNYGVKIKVLSENLGHVERSFRLKKGTSWDELELESLGPSKITVIKSKQIPELLTGISSHSDASMFEQLVGKAFELDGYTVQHNVDIKRASIDILAIKQDETLAVELKFYKQSPVDVHVVKKIVSSQRNELRGIANKLLIVSTTGFTNSAKAFVRDVNERNGGPDVELIHAKDILENIGTEDLDKDETGFIELTKAFEPITKLEDDKLKELCKLLWAIKGKRKKGKALEVFAQYVFNQIPGLKVIDTNVRTSTEEVDLLIANESLEPVFNQFGNPLFAECKHREKKTGVPELKIFAGTMKDKSVKTGIVISTSGFTRPCKRWIREQRLSQKIIIIPIYDKNLQSICDGTNLGDLIRDQFYETYKW